MTRNHTGFRHPGGPGMQRGAVLAVSLLMLFLLTLIGVTAMQTTVTEEKMAGNFRDGQVAFEATESVSRCAQEWLEDQNPIALENDLTADLASCQGKPCDLFAPLTTPDFRNQTESWWQTNGRECAAANIPAGLASQPRFIVERLRLLRDFDLEKSKEGHGLYYYRVTARGVGQTGRASTIIQNTFCVASFRTARSCR